MEDFESQKSSGSLLRSCDWSLEMEQTTTLTVKRQEKKILDKIRNSKIGFFLDQILYCYTFTHLIYSASNGCKCVSINSVQFSSVKVQGSRPTLDFGAAMPDKTVVTRKIKHL